MVYLLLAICLAAFSIWAYKAMVDVRPEVVRPKLDENAYEMIADLEGRLRRHVVALAEDIGPRDVSVPDKLNAASDYVRRFWEETSYEVHTQMYGVKNLVCQNLEAQIPGKSRPDEIVLVGAHYDTVSWSPGANDNGSAVAALLEISRLFSPRSTSRTLRFAAFTNEEPPFFKTSAMGSLVYAKACRKSKDDVVAMVCLETIGYYRDERKTQKYPVQAFARSFMEQSDFPVECAAPFGFITGIHSVDWTQNQEETLLV
jgi:hypothetical protein